MRKCGISWGRPKAHQHAIYGSSLECEGPALHFLFIILPHCSGNNLLFLATFITHSVSWISNTHQGSKVLICTHPMQLFLIWQMSGMSYVISAKPCWLSVNFSASVEGFQIHTREVESVPVSWYINEFKHWKRC